MQNQNIYISYRKILCAIKKILLFFFFGDTYDMARNGENDNVKCISKKSLEVEFDNNAS